MSLVERLLYLSIVSYTLTFIIASASLLERPRAYIKERFPVRWIGNNKHPIECRMCLGFWVSFLVCLLYSSFYDIIVVYGISYFIATQER
jgi:uncharacterized membrane protein